MEDIIKFLTDHHTLIGGAIAALLDLAFALNKNWESNGQLHWLWLQAMKLAGKKPPQS